ncbi:Aminopeptidase 2 mitochondrial [Pestalotiopsis sp. 9143b]|nr:Aminopeptidase 2 mitochondrial [Pestalotiopsis sp. 9143b]
MREVLTGGVSAPFRLPDTIEPRHYSIEIEPDLDAGTFRGRVAIQLHVASSTQYIVLHAVRLNITDASLEPEGGIISSPAVHYNTDQETIYLKLDEKLLPGSQAILFLSYHGTMSPVGNMGGLSPTPYQLPDGTVKMGFETMFEPTMARSVFPCFDEPAMKAQFSVSLVVPPALTCLSNMDIASEGAVASTAAAAAKKRVSFAVSPKMSTYLVVMVAGYFQMIETDEFRVPIRFWAAVDKNFSNAKYALDIAVATMRAHEKNFGVEYPLPKLDLVAIPGHQGGMEHWGCVTYQEGGILLPENPSVYDKLVVVTLMAHELAHQWFGNIVTMEFWDSLWLNEAFAEWASFHAMSTILPDFDIWASFVANSIDGAPGAGVQKAMELDANVGSHPIHDPNISAGSAFDSITYLKGCSVIRMMAENLGVEVFLRGVRLYLGRYMYGNATTEQLWDALSEVSGRNVAEFMTAWIQSVGFPLLTVNEYRPTGEILVTQSRFLQNGDTDKDAKLYPVSIRMLGPNGSTTHLLTGKSIRIPANPFKYKLNVDQGGFYRVAYPLSRIHKFQVQFSGDYLSVKDKIGIIADLGAIVATGSATRNVNLPDFLTFLFQIKDHIDSVYIWREVLGQLRTIESAFMFEGEVVSNILKVVRHRLVKHLITYNLFAFKSTDTTEETLLKALLFGQLKEHLVVQGFAKEAWVKLLAGNKNALNPNIRRRIFQTVAYMDDTDETWDNLKSIALEGSYILPGDPTTPLEAFESLGCSPNPRLIARALELITPPKSSAESIMQAKTAAPFVLNWAARLKVLRSLQGHPSGAVAEWQWLRENWDRLYQDRKSGQIGGFGFVEDALGGLATSAHMAEVERFFADKRDSSFEMLLTQVIDKIRARARFVNADRDALIEWARQKQMTSVNVDPC